MYEKVLSTERWPNRAVSSFPLEADELADHEASEFPVVLIAPGWGKRPEMHTQLMQELAAANLRAVGLDTRYGYADRQLPGGSPIMVTGEGNPYFEDASAHDNRYYLRRPTGFLHAAEALEIERAYAVGHSEGARIAITAATAETSPMAIDGLVLINGVGTGRAGNARSMIKANWQAVRDRHQSEASTAEALVSFRDSAIHAITHPRRVFRESCVIKGFNAWNNIGWLATQSDVPVVVMNGRDDLLIDAQHAKQQSRAHEDFVRFELIDGSHSNIYEPEVRGKVIEVINTMQLFPTSRSFTEYLASATV